MANAGETRSDARVASEGPRATGTLRPGGRAYREEIETGRSLLANASKYETPSLKSSGRGRFLVTPQHGEGQALALR